MREPSNDPIRLQHILDAIDSRILCLNYKLKAILEARNMKIYSENYKTTYIPT